MVGVVVMMLRTYVTAGAVNPTSTIQALALYIGDQIKKNIGTLFD